MRGQNFKASGLLMWLDRVQLCGICEMSGPTWLFLWAWSSLCDFPYFQHYFLHPSCCFCFICCFLVCENSAQLFKSSTPHPADKKEPFVAGDVPRTGAVNAWLSSLHLRKQVSMSG